MHPDLLLALIEDYDSGEIDLEEVEAIMSDWTASYIDALKARVYSCGESHSDA